MTVIRATFRVTTPLFSGGADANRVELREPSFKGVLRFWWRACAWARFRGDLKTICDEEERVFGGPKLGRSCVAIRFVSPAPEEKGKKAQGEVLTDAAGRPGAAGRPVGAGARYLGYGLMHSDKNAKKDIKAAQLIRGTFAQPFDLTVELRLRELTDDQRELLLDALRALGTFGGMGARSRRGYGSLALVCLEGDDVDERVTSLADVRARMTRLRDLALDTSDGWPEYTALSPRSRLLIGPRGGDAITALNRLGMAYKEFRQDRKGQHSALAAFGLPVNYGENEVMKSAEHDRRASPLFFHIHECAGQAVAIASFLPACFLPEQPIAITANRQPVRLPGSLEAFYQPVHEFLDHLTQQESFTEIGKVGRR